MRHNRQEVISRTIHEFELLDQLVSGLSIEDWDRPVPRSESKDPWTIKDTLAHITHWKANVIRSIGHQRRPLEERGLQINDGNHLIFARWHGRSPAEILAWHRQVQQDLLAALQAAPDEWYSSRDRRAEWPFDLDGHSAHHRIKDIEKALQPES